jgi:hypothetical protein
MHYRLELIYAAWRWMREAVTALFRPAPALVPMPEPLDRAELFVRLDQLRNRRRVEAEAHRIEVDELTGQWTILQAQADEIHHQLATIQHAAFCASLDHSAEEEALLRQIKDKGSMSLELFITEVQGELDAVNGLEASVMPRADRNYVTMKKTMGMDSNGPSLKRRAGALIAARQRAESMRLEPLTIEQMNTELIRLRRSIPAIENETIHTERAAILVAP